jgi:hypothetical protein
MLTARAALFLSLLLPGTVVGAKTLPVRFPAGSSEVVLKGKTTGGPSESGGMDPITCGLRARKGQKMTLHLVSPKKTAVFAIYLPGTVLLENAGNGKDWSAPSRNPATTRSWSSRRMRGRTPPSP